MATYTTTRRLSREQRRDTLLAAAAAILAERGTGGLTMERLAEVAEVSKALPYRHFDNAEQVLAELSWREIVLLGEHVAVVRSQIDDPGERLRATVETFFDVVSERPGLSQIFAAIGGPQGAPPPSAGGDSRTFLGRILVEDVALDPDRAEAAATVFRASLIGATAAWLEGGATKPDSVRIVVAIAGSLAQSLRPDADRG